MEIDSVMGKDMGVYLQNLERNYLMIHRLKPMLSRPNSKMTTYEIADPFLRFWFRFICPYQELVERRQLSLLRQYIGKNYEQFSGKTLEQYFRALFMERGEFTQVGNWWDRKGENEIDLIALNEFDHTGVIAEIKRNPNKINAAELRRKVEALPSSDFGKYQWQLQGLSMEDM
jgi:hypothetical protein